MSSMFKSVVVGILSSVAVSSFLIGITFFAFPIDRWVEIYETKVFDISYLYLVGSISIGTGFVIGFAFDGGVRRRLGYVEKQLYEIASGQKLSSHTNEKDETPIQEYILKIDEMLRKQAEISQRIATERATEREKSLQEVVLQERNRLARELHDSVSQQLFAASMMMSAINEGSSSLSSDLKRQLDLVENMIHQSQLEMRALLLHLRPIALKEKSLSEGIQELLQELKQKVPIEINSKVEDLKLEKGIEDHLFRILQESLSNTLRHARANQLQVLLIKRDQTVILRVMDDGIGFDVEEAKSSSYGLQNMKERALEIGGTCKIVSIVGQGTRLEVKIPYAKEGEEQ